MSRSSRRQWTATNRQPPDSDWKPTGRHYHEAVSAYAKSLGVLTVADYPRLHETGEPENNHAPY